MIKLIKIISYNFLKVMTIFTISIISIVFFFPILWFHLDEFVVQRLITPFMDLYEKFDDEIIKIKEKT